MFIILCGIAVVACSGGDPEEVATEVAHQWIDSSVEEVSEILAELLTSGTPVLNQLAGSLIEGQIRERVQWTLSTPSKVAEDRYKIVASARVPIDIDALIKWNSVVSLDFSLSINTAQREVVSWFPDSASFDVQSGSVGAGGN